MTRSFLRWPPGRALKAVGSVMARNGSADQVAALTPLLESDNPYLAISAAHAVLSLSPDPSQAKVD